jgi:hypothetical protein
MITNRAKKTVRSNAAGRPMNKALEKEFAEIQKLVVKAEKQNVGARHEIALRCQEIREGDGRRMKYGHGASATIAKRLGWSRSTFYEYANVGKGWPDKLQFQKLTTRIDKFGKPLSWEHFVLLANRADSEKRDGLLEDTLKHGWSVRTLRRNLADGESETNGQPTAIDPQPTPPRPLVAAARNYSIQVNVLKSNAAAFGERIIEKIKTADAADLTDAFFDQLIRSRQDLSDTVRLIDGCIAQAQERRTELGRPQDGWEDSLGIRPEAQSRDDRGGIPGQDLVGAQVP